MQRQLRAKIRGNNHNYFIVDAVLQQGKGKPKLYKGTVYTQDFKKIKECTFKASELIFEEWDKKYYPQYF